MSGQLAIQKTLNEALVNFRLKNPAFSLRALARKLELSPAAVSEILNGKRPVTRKVAQRVVNRLCLAPRDAQAILDLFPEGPRKRNATSEAATLNHARYTKLSQDQFCAISDWYHHAILSLADTEDFNDDPKWIATRIKAKIPEVRAALNRLERLGMLKRSPEGRLVSTNTSFATPDDIASLALRKAHAQHLDLAKSVLEEIDVALRDFTGMTMAIDPVKLPTAKKMIREFRDKLTHFMESGPKKEVYLLNMQLIPLSDVNGAGTSKQFSTLSKEP